MHVLDPVTRAVLIAASLLMVVTTLLLVRVAGRILRLRSVPLILVGAVWLVIASGLAAAGVWSRTASHIPPPLLLASIGPLLGALVLLWRTGSNAPTTSASADHAAVAPLIALQGYRALYGVMLVTLYGAGLLPPQFGLIAGIGDILVGAGALVVAWGATRWSVRTWTVAALVWSLFGVLDLIDANVTGILSAPTPLRHFWNEPSTVLLTTFPFALLPTFVVPLYYLLHLQTVAALWRLRQGPPAP